MKKRSNFIPLALLIFLAFSFIERVEADDGFKFNYPRVVPQLKAPTFGPPPGQNIANAILLSEALRQRNVAQLQEQENIAQREVQRRQLQIFLTNLRDLTIKLKILSNRIPAPHPGLLGVIEGYIIELKSKWGYIIEVKEYDRLLKANSEVVQIVGFPNPVHDTFNYRAVSWFRIIDGYNQAIREFSKEFGYVGEPINAREIMSAREFGMASVIYGDPLQNLTNIELKEVFNGDMSSISIEKIESAKEECQKRKVVCGNAWSDFNYLMRQTLSRFTKVDQEKSLTVAKATAQQQMENHTKYNPRTGQTFPDRYQYDPATGEQLFRIH